MYMAPTYMCRYIVPTDMCRLYKCPHLHDPMSSRSRVAYYGVFDGHAGPRASEFSAHYLHGNIMAKMPQGDATTTN